MWQHNVTVDGKGLWGRMDTCICMAESLRCSPEMSTILLVDCMPVQNHFVVKKKKKNLKKQGNEIKRNSVQFSRSVVSDSLRPHESQHARPPCPTPTHRAHTDSCPLSQWCHPTILSSVIPFSCPQSFPPSGSFPMSQLFTSRGQSIGISASTSDFQWTPRTDLL